MSGPIGILLPREPDLASLRRAGELAGLLLEASGANGTPRSVAIGLPDMAAKAWRRTEEHLSKNLDGVVVRRLQWEPVLVEHARRMFPHAIAKIDLDGIETVHVPRDWGWNFQDCDALILLADTGLGAPLILRPAAFYVPDLAARVVPEAYASSIDDAYWKRQAECFRIWRQAQLWTSDPATVQDLTSYAGVRKERIHLAPNLCDADLPRSAGSRQRKDRLAWLVEPSALHDLEIAAHALEMYLREGGQLSPSLVGPKLTGFDPAAEHEAITVLPRHIAEFLYSLPVESAYSDRELVRLLRASALVWSSRIAGGEGEVALLAGRCAIPFLGAGYSINREVVAATNVTAHLYSLNDPLAIVDALHEAEAAIGARPISAFRPLKDRKDRVAEIRSLLNALLEADRGE